MFVVQRLLESQKGDFDCACSSTRMQKPSQLWGIPHSNALKFVATMTDAAKHSSLHLVGAYVPVFGCCGRVLMYAAVTTIVCLQSSYVASCRCIMYLAHKKSNEPKQNSVLWGFYMPARRLCPVPWCSVGVVWYELGMHSAVAACQCAWLCTVLVLLHVMTALACQL